MKKCNNSGFDFILYATAISFALARDLTTAEQDLVGNFFQIVGQNLTSIAAYNNDIKEMCNPNDNLQID